MHSFFAEAAPEVGLAAENGFFYRLAGSEHNDDKDWKKLLKVNDFFWMQPVKNVI